MKYNRGSMTGGFDQEAYNKSLAMEQQKQLKANKAGAAELVADIPSELDSSGKWKLPSDADVSAIWSDDGGSTFTVGGPEGFGEEAITYSTLTQGAAFGRFIQANLVHPLNLNNHDSDMTNWFYTTFLPTWILVAQHALDTNQILSVPQICAIASRILNNRAAEAELAEKSLQMLFNACEGGVKGACVSDEDEAEAENQGGGAKRYNRSHKHRRHPRKSLRNRGKKLRKTIRRR
jgi:hypothetical protein